MEKAHADMVVAPSADPERYCDTCHGTLGAEHVESLHASLGGYKETIRTRTGQSVLSAGLEQMFDARCAKCHTTCGQCHVSRPVSVKGGFNAGHNFLKRPNMTLNCTACHGSRVGDEFRGLNAGITADVHYNKGFQCVACHSTEELHTAEPGATSRYDNSLAPACEDCHNVATSNQYHSAHGNKLSCQVCHSQEYKNCWNCHVGKEVSGITQPSELGFKIGRNPLKSAERPWNYVTLRHIPISPDSYDEWEANALVNYSALPTWKFATPHNIKKNTPQTADCTSSCHNNPAIFLTQEDLQGMSAAEQAANKNVVVTTIPD
ncbi:MAG: hypothetical protein H6696_00820 [Deferribacteres bacterium]|nr:hypothetical protein [candidate division KSB1 bacterium]MCB9500449.1 hypothetical protein [Deferribacteres bacterium]